MFNKKDDSSNLKKFFLIYFGLFSFFIIRYILIGLEQTEQTSLLLIIIPIIAGITYENKKLSSNWEILIIKIFSSIIIGMLAFIHSKQNTHITFNERLHQWMYLFVFSFVVISSIYHNKKTTPKLTEGITLIQSISFVYWLLPENLSESLFVIIGMIIVSIPTLYSIYHAITNTKLTHYARLYLSIWSSVIMLIFSLNYLQQLKNNYNPDNIFLNLGEFFILGVSLIYIFQNAVLVLGYLFVKKDEQIRKKLNDRHIQRYSSKQVNIKDSIFIIILCVCVYTANFLLELIPRETLIWIVFILTPIILKTRNLLKTKAQ